MVIVGYGFVEVVSVGLWVFFRQKEKKRVREKRRREREKIAFR